jgi:ankyrin repeat protein
VVQEGKTALQWAALGGHECVLEELLRAGADPHVRDKVSE